MKNMLINMDDTQLLMNINNYMGSQYHRYDDVDWVKFFEKKKPFGDIPKMDVLVRVLLVMKKNRIVLLEKFLKSSILTNYQIDKFIHLIETDYNYKRYEEFKLAVMARLLGLLITTQEVNDEQIKKIVNIFKDDRHGCLDIIISSIATYKKLTKETLEQYIYAFSVKDWLEISKNTNLWSWYGTSLFRYCPCTPYINVKNVLISNYIHETDLFSLFYDDPYKITTKIFDIEDHLYILEHIQFSMYNLRRLIKQYQGSEQEDVVIPAIMKTQQLTDGMIDLTIEFKELFEKYGYKDEQWIETLRKLIYKKRKNIKLIKNLKKNGFEIKTDELGKKYIECYPKYVQMCSYYYSTFEDVSHSNSLIFKEEYCQTNKILPLSVRVQLNNIPCGEYSTKYKVMLQDIISDFSFGTFFSRNLLLIK